MGDNKDGKLTRNLRESALGISDSAIKKELLSNAIQHPATSIPFATGILAFIYLEFFSSSFGGSKWAVLALIFSGVITIASFVWQSVIRYPSAYAEKVHDLIERREKEEKAREEATLHQLRGKIEKGFSSIDSTEGLQAFRELEYEYQQLRSALNQEKELEYLSLADIHDLAGKTYRQGLSVLADAVELGQVVHSMNKKRLAAETQNLEREVLMLARSGRQTAQINIKKAALNSHKERLEMITRQQVQIEKLLYQCDQCEASLQRTRIELAALKTQRSETSVQAVTDTLQQTINQAKEVQEELKNLGF